jgi:hypothetical protein
MVQARLHVKPRLDQLPLSDASGSCVCAFIQAITSAWEYRIDRRTRMNGGPTLRWRQACRVRVENEVRVATSSSVRIRSVVFARLSGIVLSTTGAHGLRCAPFRAQRYRCFAIEYERGDLRIGECGAAISQPGEVLQRFLWKWCPRSSLALVASDLKTSAPGSPRERSLRQ